MKLTYRKDYQAPSYKILTTHLDFTLDPHETRIVNTMSMEKIEDKPLLLNGRDDVKLVNIALNGNILDKKDYQLVDNNLILSDLPDKPFELKIETIIAPAENTRLMGLYMSNGIFCTQCEPEGFRGITYFLDHPDVMSKYTVVIHADRQKYPVLLSNGNKIQDVGNTVKFEDPTITMFLLSPSNE